jgi:predicted hydrocarbon binding protein
MEDRKEMTSRIATKELKNIVADTIERVYEEFGSKLDRLNAEDKALQIVRAVKYGVDDTQQLKITDNEVKAKLCKSCGS